MRRLYMRMLTVLFVASLFVLPVLSKEHFQVTFNGNGANISSIPSSLQAETGELVKLQELPLPTKTGYSFGGWEYEQELVTELRMPAKNVELLARWHAQKQKVQFRSLLPDAEHMPSEKTYFIGELYDVTTVPTPTHARYTFAGWHVGGVHITSPLAVPYGGIRFDAKWEGSYEVVQLDINGGTVPSNNLEVHKMIGETLDVTTLEEPTKSGYVFAGWSLGDKKVTEAVVVPYGGLTLRADWIVENGNMTLTSKHDRVTMEAKASMQLDVVEIFGFTAFDVIDGDITDKIQTWENTIALHKPGIYYIEVFVRNSEQQYMMQLVTLEIVDTTPPAITLRQDTIERYVGITEVLDFQALLGVETYDIVDGDFSLLSFTVEDTFDPLVPGAYQVQLKATDKSGNTAQTEAKLLIKPFAISGNVYLAGARNASPSASYKNLAINLVDTERKQAVATVQTDTNGAFELVGYPDKKALSYELCVVRPSGYMLDTTIFHAKTTFEYCSNAYSVNGSAYIGQDVLLYPEIETVSLAQQVSIREKERVSLEILVEHGHILNAVAANETIVTVEQYGDAIYVVGKQKGETLVTITFEDLFGNEVKTQTKLEVHVR